MDEQIAFFKKNGYVVIPAALSATEVAGLNQALDIDRQKYPQLWPERGEGGRSQSVSVLLTSTAFDCTIRHPAVLPLLGALMGEELCFAELSVMVRAPLDQEPSPPVWHRDKENWPEHPLALHQISAVYYLTDVDENTHCFGVVPEGLEAKMASPTDRDGTNGVELYGRAGTVILFNAGSVHAGVVRCTVRDRRTVHVYYGHRSQPPLSNHTIFPRRLLEAKDEATRLFYSRPNLMTQLICDNF